MVSVFYFTPLPGFFSPFPHGTCSLSVIREYLALRDGPRFFRQDFSCLAVLFLTNSILDFNYRTFTFFGPPSQSGSFIKNFICREFGFLPFRSSLLRKSLLLSFPPATKIFQFAGSCLPFSIPCLLHGELPHSDIYGSLLTYCYP